ncbi:hypothetical protein NP590_19250 [Methylomonas sp. SURF-2]|uniref:Secreted protein n=1 Tax=Methylomonas subterranea TaxID=2952225 RepID=A0ABT1TLQ7_9GAMM|nr:hypothetical protein [Methylomonas sp. SURF-2]MCQ8106254.1 hypothetical protein [Methylomonas sp. SURF-2]
METGIASLACICFMFGLHSIQAQPIILRRRMQHQNETAIWLAFHTVDDKNAKTPSYRYTAHVEIGHNPPVGLAMQASGAALAVFA